MSMATIQTVPQLAACPCWHSGGLMIVSYKGSNRARHETAISLWVPT